MVPKMFEGDGEWTSTMDGWGGKVLAACEAAAEMMALGFGKKCQLPPRPPPF